MINLTPAVCPKYTGCMTYGEISPFLTEIIITNHMYYWLAGHGLGLNNYQTSYSASASFK